MNTYLLGVSDVMNMETCSRHVHLTRRRMSLRKEGMGIRWQRKMVKGSTRYNVENKTRDKQGT